jgi:ankyrin repeat protein
MDGYTSVKSEYLLHDLVESLENEKLRQVLQKQEAGDEENTEENGEKYDVVYSLDSKDDDRCTPLHVAILSRNLDAMSIILEFGEKYDVLSDNCNGSPILHLLLSVVSLKENRITSFGMKAFQLLASHGCPIIDAFDEYHRSALHICAYFDLPEYASAILTELDTRRAFLDENSSTNTGPALFAADMAQVKEDDSEDLRWEDLDEAKQQEYELEAKNANEAIEQEIAKYKINLAESRDKLNYSTPLHVACMYHSVAVAKILIQHNVDINARDGTGSTPLNLAYQLESSELISLLHTSKGIDASIADYRDRKPVFWKSRSSNRHRRGKTLLLTHQSCLEHHSCSVMDSSTRGRDRPPENVNRLKVLVDTHNGLLRCTRIENSIDWGIASRANTHGRKER